MEAQVKDILAYFESYVYMLRCKTAEIGRVQISEKITRGLVQKCRSSKHDASTLRCNRHFAQGLDASLERRMRAEEGGQRAAPEERFHDAKRGSRRAKCGGRDPLVVGSQLLECANEPVGLSDHPRTGFVGGVLSLARRTELQQHCSKGRQKK